MKVGILPNDDDSCGWVHNLLPAPAATPLTGARSFDHVVLGAGFTGLGGALFRTPRRQRLCRGLPQWGRDRQDQHRAGRER